MKIIHCADLHLDSKLNANLDKERAKIRKSEILNTFGRMVDYAVLNGVEAIIIAGDLFDTASVSRTTRNGLLRKITEYPRLRFYYLRGNHDDENFLSTLEEQPENLYLFEEHWTTYLEGEGNIAISGRELSEGNYGTAALSLQLDEKQFNIVLLHGQEADARSKDGVAKIPLKDLRNKGIDYLALGHIHSYKREALDARGVYCYPGCLEGRGFDECGDHGFVLLEIDEDKRSFSEHFISFASRRLWAVTVDVSGCMSTEEIFERAEEVLKKNACGTKDMVKLILAGDLDVTCEKDLIFLQSRLEREFFFLKIQDNTRLRIEERDYSLDESLKGEFVRTVMSDETLSAEEKGEIIRYGLQALAGEEIGS